MKYGNSNFRGGNPEDEALIQLLAQFQQPQQPRYLSQQQGGLSMTPGQGANSYVANPSQAGAGRGSINPIMYHPEDDDLQRIFKRYPQYQEIFDLLGMFKDDR